MDPLLFNLAAGRDKETFGTLSHHNKWNLFDQILRLPGPARRQGLDVRPGDFPHRAREMKNRRGHPWGFDEDDEGRRDKKRSGEARLLGPLPGDSAAEDEELIRGERHEPWLRRSCHSSSSVLMSR